VVQGSVVQDLRKQIAKYEAEIGAQMLTLDTLARERDGSRSGAVESGERAKVSKSAVSPTSMMYIQGVKVTVIALQAVLIPLWPRVTVLWRDGVRLLRRRLCHSRSRCCKCAAMS
jgi:hypothetical protein